MNDASLFSNWISETPNELNLVLDIGANYGDFFDLVKHKTIKKYVYFEPDVVNYKRCVKKMQDYDFVEGHNCGIFYGKRESLVQGIGDNNDGGYMVSEIDTKFKDDIWGGRLVYYQDKVFKLKELEEVISEPCDLIKIDVEASEYNIVENSKIVKESNNLMIEWHNQPSSFIIEFISQHLPNHNLYKMVGTLTYLKLKK